MEKEMKEWVALCMMEIKGKEIKKKIGFGITTKRKKTLKKTFKVEKIMTS